MLVYNADDTIIEKHLPRVLQRQVGFSRYLESDFTARKTKLSTDDQPAGTEFTLSHQVRDYKFYNWNSLVHKMYILASAVANELDIPLVGAVNSIHSLQSPG